MAEPGGLSVRSLHRRVTDRDTAVALDSGEVPVLATPRLIAWMETATVESAAPYLTEEETSVGTGIRIAHRRAVPVGGGVDITATLPPGVTGPRLTFDVRAVDDSGEIVAVGEIDRRVVDRQRFLTAVRDPAGRS